LNIKKASKCFGYSRQYYYIQLHKNKIWYDLEKLIVGIILDLRKNNHKYGMDKTYYYLRDTFRAAGIKIGRDKLRNIMRRNGLKLKVKRRARYTQPIALQDAENKMYGIDLYKPNQVWFADITYLKTEENGMVRLALVMDGYSRRILSYELGNGPAIATKALKKAMIYGQPEMHHSDRGIDYVNDGYTYLLKNNEVTISFSRAGVPQDNGIMERTIGILKNELKLKMSKNIDELKKKIEEVISFYNDRRIHMSCNYKTPSSIYFKNYFVNQNCQLILA